MTDRPERDDLLPGDATPLESAISETEGRLDAIDMDLARRIGGPDIAQVPAAYLAHRAWQSSVDVWDPIWPEAVRRDVIVAAPIVHRRKGSLDAVERALAALRIDARVVEWWQQSPQGPAYTFRVTAYARSPLYAGDFILDPRLIKVAFASVMAAKPLSRAFRFAVGAGFQSPTGLVGVGVGTAQHRATVHAPSRIAARQTLALAGIGVARAKHRAAVTLRSAP